MVGELVARARELVVWVGELVVLGYNGSGGTCRVEVVGVRGEACCFGEDVALRREVVALNFAVGNLSVNRLSVTPIDI